LDKSQRTKQYSSPDFLANSGIPTKIEGFFINKAGKDKVPEGATKENITISQYREALEVPLFGERGDI